MFEATKLLFLYAVSPVHMGAGTAIGVIDNPIQRERHTNHPIFAGSGLKGAFRDLANPLGGETVAAIFGPDTERASEGAGALSVTDAQIVLFPVRSLKESYAYATCPTALGRLRRLAEIAGVAVDWGVPAVADGDCLLTASNSRLKSGGHLVLESFQFACREDGDAKRVGSWLALHALPSDDANRYFRNKVEGDLVVLSDSRFGYFVRNATSVEPHVRISDVTGTADDGGLFYTENLPPESLLVSLVMASRSRTKAQGQLKAAQVLAKFEEVVHGRLAQVGGDASTGRGLVIARLVPEGVAHA